MTKKWKCRNQFHSYCSTCYDLRLGLTYCRLTLKTLCWGGWHWTPDPLASTSKELVCIMWLACVVLEYLAKLQSKQQEDSSVNASPYFYLMLELHGSGQLFSTAWQESYPPALTLSQNSPEIVRKALGWGKTVCLLSSWPLEFLHRFDSNSSEIKHSSQ